MNNSLELENNNDTKKSKKTNKNKNKKPVSSTTLERDNNALKINNDNNPSSRRLREVLQNSMIESVTKVPRMSNTESPFKLMITMDKRFEKLTEDLTEKLQTIIQTMFRECEERLLSEIDKRLNITKNDLNIVTERVTSLESAVENIKNTAMDEVIALRSETEDLKNEIAFLKNFARKHENSIVAYDIRITNVPTEKNEDLYEKYFRLCDAVNISPPNVKAIYRVKNNRNQQFKNKNKQNNSKPYDAAIIVKFKCPYERNFVLKSITSFIKNQKTPLRLNVLGFNSSVPFYVNENLTPDNHRIFLKANSLKREGKISAAFVNRGLVYIRQLNCDDPICIFDYDQFNQLFFCERNEENIPDCHETL